MANAKPCEADYTRSCGINGLSGCIAQIIAMKNVQETDGLGEI